VTDEIAGPLALELVNEQGSTVWHGTAVAQQGNITARVSQRLEGGLYSFRVYEGHELLREYGLRVK
jgi:hypothetical protein